MSVTTSHTAGHQHRRPSRNATSAPRPERRQSLRSNTGTEGIRMPHARLQERDRLQDANRAQSEANLYTLHQGWDDHDAHETQEDYGGPFSNPRKLSQTSKASFSSYSIKLPDVNPFQSVNIVNIAVLGDTSVGKSTFIRRTLDVEHDATSRTSSRVLGISGSLCTIRMFEMGLDEVYDGEDRPLNWPSHLDSTTIHVVVTLYDVGSKASFRLVPEVLNAVNKMSLPSVLVASKCDVHSNSRQVEPRIIEQRAASAFDKITSIQISQSTSESYKKALTAILGNVAYPAVNFHECRYTRQRNHSNVSSVTGSPVSPRRPPPAGRSRSTSEFPSSRRHDSLAMSVSGRAGSSIASKPTSLTSTQHEGSSSSFYIDESLSDTETASQTSLSAQDTDVSDGGTEKKPRTPVPQIEELGWTFDALVDRLLVVPTSKADSKFAAIFLSLYRKFAPPGRLLEAVVVRFEELDQNEPVMLTRIASQLRYLTIVEQWIHSYPGDFAHPKTLRRIRTFVAKLQKNRIFAVAAQEMNNDLGRVVEDDDTEWAYCDKSRKDDEVTTVSKWSYRGSLLIDDPDFEFTNAIGKLTLKTPGNTASQNVVGADRNTPFEDLAQREASKLVPSYVYPLHKNAWRALLATPHEVIAKDMTRMDWIMFSSIRPRDLVRHVSLSQTQKARCKSLANVSRMIEHFNYIRDWTTNFILYRDKPKHRAQMLEYFVAVARKLRDLNNYNSLGAVLAGIHSNPVHRLTATLDAMSPEANKDCMKLEILMAQTRSFSSYRLAWENTTGERIPYLPLPIRDLVGAESGNRTFVGGPSFDTPSTSSADDSFTVASGGSSSNGPADGDRRINWRKFEIMGDVLVGIQRAQGVPYKITTLGPRDEEVRLQILHTRIERSDEVLYIKSVALEAVAGGEKKGFMKGVFKR